MKQLLCNPSSLPHRLVNFGVDTLILNVRYADENLRPAPGLLLSEELIARFDEWQAVAKSQEGAVPVPGLIFRETDVFIYPHGAGKGQWRWILDCPEVFKLYLGRGHLNGMIAQVRFASAYLWSFEESDTHEQNIWESIIRLGDFLSDLLGGKLIHLQVSEIHLCADIAGWDIATCHMNQFLSRARTRTRRDALVEGPDDTIFFGRAISTLDFGTHGSPLSACIYDKVREIKKSGKTWFECLWRHHGWDGKSPVTRVECRWHREALHEIKQDGVFHGIESVSDLDNRLSYLWSYCVGHTQLRERPDGWLRFVEPSNHSNHAYWPLHPAWSVVQSAFCTLLEPAVDITTGEVFDLPASPLSVLIRERQRQVNLDRLALQMEGCASTLSAWLSDPGTESPLTMPEVFDWLEANIPSLKLRDLARLGETIAPPDLLKLEHANQFTETSIEKQGLYGRRSAFDL